MKAETLALADVFGKDVRYVIPLYQRPYVWKEETHWQPLWEDVLWVLRHASDASNDKPTPHFLGALVLEQQHTQLGEIERRLVIDGQQRLTTLQLFLAAATEVALEFGFDNEAILLGSLSRNSPERASSVEERLKVWPTNTNRAAFVAVMSPADAETLEDDPSNRVHEAHAFFLSAIKDWLAELDEENIELAAQYRTLVAVIRELLKLVVINLEPEDNAQGIFETLNARGTPLLAIDLAKNLVFQRARATGQDEEDLYAKYWREFDQAFWRHDVRQGRLKRPRAELFLMHWLTMMRAEDVHANQLFTTFKRLVDDPQTPPVIDLMREFATDGENYATFERGGDGPVPRRFFARLSALDTGTPLPIALWLYRIDTDSQTRDATLLMLESWYVRRMLCRLTAQGYNRLAVDHLKALQANPAAPDQVTFDRLTRLEGNSSVWPDDAELLRTLTEEPVYNRLTQARTVDLLWELEQDMRTDFVEQLPVPDKLTIEHVLPQKWRKHWPVDGSEAELDRDGHVHKLGNLTLVTSKLNPSMSNGPWSTKTAALNAHSVLLMNRRIVDNSTYWDEATIAERSTELARRAIQLWPGPQTTLEQWRSNAERMSTGAKTKPS